MGTRSTISMCKKEADGRTTYKGVYCHWDGYPSYNGRVLLEHYSSEEKVEELVRQGSLSSLGQWLNPDPSTPHTFDKPQEGVCVFYRRDRGEDWENTKPHEAGSEEELYDGWDAWQEYEYLFRDGKWYYRSARGKSGEYVRRKWNKLTKEVCEESG